MANLSPKEKSKFIESESAKVASRFYVHLIRSEQDGIISSNSGFNPETYSLMKHGHPVAIDTAARELFEYIVCNDQLRKLITDGKTVVTNSAREVPTASFTIMQRLVEVYLNPYLENNNGNKVTWVRSERAGKLVESDYGTLSKEEREKRMAERKPYFSEDSKRELVGKTVILFDDLVATGTYEQSQTKLLVESGVPSSRIVRLYWVQIDPETGLNPEFEAVVNYAAIKNIKDLIGFFCMPELIINERTLKFIFPKVTELRSFFEELHKLGGDITLMKLWKAGNTRDNYRDMERLRPGYDILEDYLKELKLI